MIPINSVLGMLKISVSAKHRNLFLTVTVLGVWYVWESRNLCRILLLGQTIPDYHASNALNSFANCICPQSAIRSPLLKVLEKWHGWDCCWQNWLKKCRRMEVNLHQCVLLCLWVCVMECVRFCWFLFENTNAGWNLSCHSLLRQRLRARYGTYKSSGIPKLTAVRCLATSLTQASGVCGVASTHRRKELSVMQLLILSAPAALCLSPCPPPNCLLFLSDLFFPFMFYCTHIVFLLSVFTPCPFTAFCSNSIPRPVHPSSLSCMPLLYSLFFLITETRRCERRTFICEIKIGYVWGYATYFCGRGSPSSEWLNPLC